MSVAVIKIDKLSTHWNYQLIKKLKLSFFIKHKILSFGTFFFFRLDPIIHYPPKDAPRGATPTQITFAKNSDVSFFLFFVFKLRRIIVG